MTFEGKLFNAPLDPKKTSRILDVGTGTGIWAIDYGMLPKLNFEEHSLTYIAADEHPESEVTCIFL